MGKISRLEYARGCQGVKYGVWNCRRKEYQFGICEDSPALAMARLTYLIGEDARKWRFEPRRLPRAAGKRNAVLDGRELD